MDKNGNNRTRNWAFILYPESAPEDWQRKLQQTNVKFAVSPLHDSDLNESTNEPKKAHHHIILSFDSVKSFNQVQEICSSLNATIPQKINSIIGAVRYLTHKDNPEKAQYLEKDIVCGNGFDCSDYLAKSKSEKDSILDEIIDFIIDNDVCEFFDLVVYAKRFQPDWYDILKESHTIFITNLIKSNRHRRKLYDKGEI